MVGDTPIRRATAPVASGASGTGAAVAGRPPAPSPLSLPLAPPPVVPPPRAALPPAVPSMPSSISMQERCELSEDKDRTHDGGTWKSETSPSARRREPPTGRRRG